MMLKQNKPNRRVIRMATKKETLATYGIVALVVGLAVAGTGGSIFGALGCIIASFFFFYKAAKTQ